LGRPIPSGATSIRYEPASAPKSTLYINFLPLLNSGRVDLLDNPRLVAQLVGLERHTARSGREAIDHAVGAHDDIANAVAGAAAIAIDKYSYRSDYQWVSGPDTDVVTDLVPPFPKRRHPNLTDEQLDRISAPVALRPCS